MMHNINEILLMTGEDILVGTSGLKLKQPTIREIGRMGGETKLFQSLSVFYLEDNIMKGFIQGMTDLDLETRTILEDSITPFNTIIFLLGIYQQQGMDQEYDSLFAMVKNTFSLVLPEYDLGVSLENELMLLIPKDGSQQIIVDDTLFEEIKSVLHAIFILDTFFATKVAPEMSEEAKKIAAKIAAAEKKIGLEEDTEESADGQFALIISILGVQHPIDYLKDLTVYQLYNQFERFNLYSQHDQSIRAAMFGGSGVEIVNWYKKI